MTGLLEEVGNLVNVVFFLFIVVVSACVRGVIGVVGVISTNNYTKTILRIGMK